MLLFKQYTRREKGHKNPISREIFYILQKRYDFFFETTTAIKTVNNLYYSFFFYLFDTDRPYFSWYYIEKIYF